MTLEQALLAALSVVTGALVYVAKILWAMAIKCESDRYELREEVEQLKSDNGLANGTLISFKRCPANTCPFRDHLSPIDPNRLP